MRVGYYWLWTPADFDLADTARRAKALQDHEALYKACPRLDGIFIPGGDPGDNHPSLVVPFMKDLSVMLARHHPRAKIWLSLQGYRGDRAEYVYRFLDEEKPAWFGGIVCGPSSPSSPSTRERLDPRYPIRSYPDITHNVRCQHPIPWWDTALAVTLGREAINPRPVQYAEIHNAFAPYTAGFIVIRTSGYGTCLLSIDGERVRPAIDHTGIGEFKEFPVPRALLADGTLHLTFERPAERVNWRYQSRLSEIWLLKK
jgi:hypothetical protein